MITIAITKIVMLPTYPKKQQKIFSPLHQKRSLTKFRHAAQQQSSNHKYLELFEI